ncbi:uncharacterized protein PV07_08333 [Cladophialophora immunda]|uniref:Uncharacterized protein n=1 Tax=Cladophialophora immunda TaxID=569365 RepID=A0A0D2CC72_9EURO|nr:uncharacterized protein PV07_08333 [Cladophialophora immunda]KIW28693.1 hypothetical protein PV07_08333 [Cladophialophora immunda]
MSVTLRRHRLSALGRAYLEDRIPHLSSRVPVPCANRVAPSPRGPMLRTGAGLFHCGDRWHHGDFPPLHDIVYTHSSSSSSSSCSLNFRPHVRIRVSKPQHCSVPGASRTYLRGLLRSWKEGASMHGRRGSRIGDRRPPWRYLASIDSDGIDKEKQHVDSSRVVQKSHVPERHWITSMIIDIINGW